MYGKLKMKRRDLSFVCDEETHLQVDELCNHYNMSKSALIRKCIDLIHLNYKTEPKL